MIRDRVKYEAFGWDDWYEDGKRGESFHWVREEQVSVLAADYNNDNHAQFAGLGSRVPDGRPFWHVEVFPTKSLPFGPDEEEIIRFYPETEAATATCINWIMYISLRVDLSDSDNNL